MSFRARILLLVLAASLLPMLVMLGLLFEAHRTSLAQARQQLETHAAVLAGDLDDKISGTAQLLFGLSRVGILDGEDRQACSHFLSDVLKEHPQYTGLLTIRPSGALHCDSLRTGRTLDLSDRRYFQLARTAQAPVIEATIGRLTGKGVLQIAYPVRDAAGALRYVLLASLDMQAYGLAAVSRLPYPRANLQVWNGDGSVIMDHPGPDSSPLVVLPGHREFMLGTGSPPTVTLGQGGLARIWARAVPERSGNAGLRMAVVVPEVDLNQQVDGPFRQALIGLAAATLAIFVAAAAMGELAVRRHTARLMQAISQLDAGDYRPPIGGPYPGGELGQVMQAVDRMAASLARQRSEIERHTEALERQARIDPLTHLANRHMLTDRLGQALHAARHDQRTVGVMLLDLDRFKTVNDSLGHSQGDELLREVALRLLSCVRKDDTVARLGGDEFVVVLADMADGSDVEPVARKILLALADPVELGPQMLSVSTSLGIAIFPRDGQTADELLQYADTAMYQAKDQGGNALAFFTPEMRQAMLERLQIEAGLRQAINQGELCLEYQPIIDASNGQVTSAEALLRWRHPIRGLVSPMAFIPIAEETGLIVPIGEWVMRQACAQARAWRDQGLGEVAVAVNLSARQFAAPGLDETIAAALRDSGCPPHLLQLEITESSIMDRVDLALDTMHRVTRLGVCFSIDDFGTGYSSLSQLKTLPVSALKVDRSFVRDIEHDRHDEVLVDAILTLARKLGLRTVAEGVETEQQRAFLATCGCDCYQGYLFARPSSPDALAELVRQRRLAAQPSAA